MFSSVVQVCLSYNVAAHKQFQNVKCDQPSEHYIRTLLISMHKSWTWILQGHGLRPVQA